MPFILEKISDRRGNILPNTLVAAREADNPSGDEAQANSNAFGQVKLVVNQSGTLYDLWYGEITNVDATNYLGQALSSGDVVSSFTLCDDPSWKSEHYGTGEAEPCGEHKSTVHDDILIRTSGYVKTTDSFFDLRFSTDTNKLRIDDDSDTFFFNPKSSSGLNNTHIGLKEAYDASATRFYFGSAKSKYINSSGDFVLNGGTFGAAVTFSNNGTFNQRATFSQSLSNYPRVTSPYTTAPNSDEMLTPKGYVDAAIAAAIPGIPDKIEEANSSVEVIDTGSGQIVVTIDGSIYGNWSNGKFAFGGNFSASELVHLKAPSAVALMVERTGVGASTAKLGENWSGTSTNTGFYLKSNGTNAAIVDISQNFGIGIFSSLLEKLHVAGNLQLENYITFDTKNTPAQPPSGQARMYLKNDPVTGNDVIAIWIQKSGSFQEVIIA